MQIVDTDMIIIDGFKYTSNDYNFMEMMFKEITRIYLKESEKYK